MGDIWCLLTRSCFPHRSPQLRGPFNGNVLEGSFRQKFSEVEELANLNMAAAKETLTEKFSCGFSCGPWISENGLNVKDTV